MLTADVSLCSPFSRPRVPALLHIFWIFTLAAVSISSSSSFSCLSSPPPTPEICRLLFALVPFNVSPSPSPPCPPRAPRGPSSICRSLIRADAFTCSRIFPRRSPTSPAQTENPAHRPSRASSTKPYSLHISASAAEQPAKTSPIRNRADPRRVRRIQVPEEEQTDDPNKGICWFSYSLSE